ncbi:MAG: hypothetical protein PW788_13950 [Micavibrio sp.]|nr:hypothetical protein [Micavibrio sp.]
MTVDITPQEPPKEAPKKETTFVRDFERRKLQRAMKEKAMRDMVWHAVVEWSLIRCLAYAERMIVAALCVCFPLDLQHDFLSFSGVEFTIGALVILGPVFGIVMFLTLMPVYVVLRRRGRLPKSVAEYRKIIIIVAALLSPIVFYGTYYVMKIYYEMVGAAPIMQQFKDITNYSFFPKSK